MNQGAFESFYFGTPIVTRVYSNGDGSDFSFFAFFPVFLLTFFACK
jgi:hypothetical protein